MARDPKIEKDQTIEELNAQIAELKAQLADLAGNLKAQASGLKAQGADLAEDLKARGEDVVEDVRGRARRAYSAAVTQSSALKARANDYLDEADTAVRENPATAMGVAVGVGFLLGLLITRR